MKPGIHIPKDLVLTVYDMIKDLDIVEGYLVDLVLIPLSYDSKRKVFRFTVRAVIEDYVKEVRVLKEVVIEAKVKIDRVKLERREITIG